MLDLSSGRLRRRAIAVLGLPALLCAACSSEGVDGATRSQTSDAGQRSTSAPHGSAPIASAGQSATTAAPSAELVGTWRADFDAKKGTVTLDPGVAEPAWKNDDGSKLVGRGALELIVAADGTVSGKLSGALGQAVVAGSAEDGRITAIFTPSDSGEQAMAGTLTLSREGEGLVGTLRASSGDAKLVRMASLSLGRAAR